MKKIKVLIVDDHTMVRTGVRHLLNSEDDMDVVGEASDGIEGLRLAKKLLPDVVVLDISMPNMGGLEAIAMLHKATPQVKVVILSMFGKESFAYEALGSGAYAYVLKGAPGTDLLEAIRSANEGRYYFSKEVHDKVIKSYVSGHHDQQEENNKYNLLSDRERQVFRLIIEGNSTRQIADILRISNKTAEKHRTSITKKLEVNNPVEMMKYAIKIGLVDPQELRN